jgi:pentatricopeptide repeat protein
LKASSSTGAIDITEEIHEQILNRNLLDKDVVLGTALVDAYAKCGLLEKSQRVLKELPTRDVVAWNTLIAGLAQQGQGHEALNCFEVMQSEGFSPDAVTLLCILSACGRSGLLDEAQEIFGNMASKYKVTPNVKHHTCMVVVFGYAGLFDKAMSVIEVMPSSDYHDVWVALLGACRKWGNVELGIVAFDQAVQLDDSCAVAYVLIANIFAAAGMKKDADRVEAMRRKYAVWQDRGNSVWVDASGNAHSFSLGVTRHSQSKAIHAKIKDISLKMEQSGFLSSAHWMVQSSYVDGKNDVHCGHSVKLAIACALINSYKGETIHVLSNTGLCGHCHFGALLISKIENRKIMARDPNHLHIFENGKCVCGASDVLSSMFTEDVSSPLNSVRP